MGLTRGNDLHPGFGRRNRPRASAEGGFEADLGTEFSNELSVQAVLVVSERCATIITYFPKKS
jgi:hypothetical protein